jgi:beta-1,4-mannosyltransferase
MSDTRRIFLYPQTPFGHTEGANDYMDRLRALLDQPFRVINKPTRLGLIDLLRRLPQTDIVYLNWIEDLADKRFGYVQLALLLPLLLICRLCGKQVVWFVHNNVSHSPRHWRAKRYTVLLMKQFAHTVLAHAEEASRVSAGRAVAVCDHPAPGFTPLPPDEASWDLLIWGSVSPYKGVLEFVRLHAAHPELRGLKVLVAGKFSSAELFEAALAAAHPNLTLRNEMIPERELPRLLAQSRYVLFAYQAASVLGSAALSRTLAFGKTVIGPDCGAFRSLAARGLLYSYRNDEDLIALLSQLQAAPRFVEEAALRHYTGENSWSHFGVFLQAQLEAPTVRPGWNFVLR